MKKKEIVKSNKQFNNIINKGIKFNNKIFSLFCLPNDNNKKLFGLAVGTKIGDAVTRNHYKRQLRCLIDKYKNKFPNNQEYIIILKKGNLNLDCTSKYQYSYQVLDEKLLDLIDKVNNEK